jgi:hypothetical protein
MKRIAALVLAAMMLLSTTAYADSAEDYVGEDDLITEEDWNDEYVEEPEDEDDISVTDPEGDGSNGNDSTDEPESKGSLDNFTAKRSYQNNFQDVSTTAWYYGVVKVSYEYGLIDGESRTRFSPEERLTVAQCIKLAACLNQIFYEGQVSLTNAQSGSWYTPYASYCLEQGILTAEPSDYDRVITRAEAAELFANALPEDVLPEIKTVQDGAIPDVSLSSSYAEAVYRMYRAGVFTGTNTAGSFSPDGYLLRSEAAAILARLADPDQRVR